MNSNEFEYWCSQQHYSAQTTDLIAMIRSSPPSRRVQSGNKNVSGVYPSRKMGLTIQFESRTVELWAIYHMEHDPKVLEFYDQPPPFKIQYKNQSGRNIGHYHTPDFFVLRDPGAGWEEWKKASELEKLAEKYPGRYQKTESGCWRCPPGEAHASQFGLNLIFLEDYYGSKSNLITVYSEKIHCLVQENPGITITALLSELVGVCANDIYIMIATEQIYVDLSDVHIIEHWRTRLWSDQQTHDAYTQTYKVSDPTEFDSIYPKKLLPNTVLIWDSSLWTLVNFGETTTTLIPESGFQYSYQQHFFSSYSTVAQ